MSFATITSHLFGLSRLLGRDGLLTAQGPDVIGCRHALLAHFKGVRFALVGLLMYVIDGQGMMVVTMASGVIGSSF
jgi:hypothetical protein